MTSIFIAYTEDDAQCTEQLRQGLEAQGYSVWRQPTSLTLESITYPRTIENVITGCAAVPLVWSRGAAQSPVLARHLLFAQQLKKPIFPVLLDTTSLPQTLVGVTPLVPQNTCIDALTALLAQAHFPEPQSSEPLVLLWEQATDEKILQRKAAIETAAEMLKRNEQREAVLALLAYLAHSDLMMGVREKAQDILAADTAAQKAPALPAFINPADARHMHPVRCKNGHVTYFDKRIVCTAHTDILRQKQQYANSQPDELYLKCETCKVEVVAHIDCREYRGAK